MADLRDLLRYLKREDVTSVLLQTDSPVTLEVGGERRPLSKQPLSADHIQALVASSPIVALMPSRDADVGPVDVELFGKKFSLGIARRGDRYRLRFTRATASAPEAAAPPEMVIERNIVPGAAPAPATSPKARAPAAAATPEAARPPVSAPSPQQPVGASADRGLARLLVAARQQGASDLHVTSNRPAQLRVLGRMRPVGEAIGHAQLQAMLEPLLGRHKPQFDELGYADLAVDVQGVGRLRVNINRHRAGHKGCFRLVMQEPPTLESLCLPEELMRITNQHQGLVVIAGPTGQGKTTTMSALVDWFNTNRPIHIITVEDPVEIIHPVKKAIVSQREVGTHTATFASALKGSLREDPDVIAIGELRDRETVEMALSAAETGHLVMATISTPNGAKTIDRLIDMFPPDDQSQVRSTMAGALKFVVSQRLVPTVDNKMVAAAELITGNIPLWKLIRDNKLFQLPSLQQRGRSYGMVRLEDSLMELVRAGKITIDVAKGFAEDPRAIDGAARKQVAQAAQPAQPARQPPAAARDGRIGGGLKNLFGRKG